jgi:major membrane immunogen (membrane-anchored lipoprotein)
MAILDRPLFQRRPTRDELRRYGLLAFANGGIVYANTGGLQMQSAELKPGGKVPGRRYYNKETGKLEVYQPEPETAITSVLKKDYEDKILRDLKTPPPVLTQPTVTEETTTTTEETTPEETTTTTEEETTTTNEEMAPQTSGDRELFDKFKKKSETYRNILKEYGEDDFRTQAFLQLAQFGLNLASAQGSNFIDKVAKASRDPLANFAKLAQEKSSFMKELDFLALQKAEGEITKEEERAFQKEEARLEREQDLRIAMLKEEDKSAIQKIADSLVGKKDPNTGEIYTAETALSQAIKNHLFEKTQLREEYQQKRFTFYREQDNSVEEAKILAQEDVDAIYGESIDDKVLTEEIIKKAMEQNQGRSREEIINALEGQGFIDVNNVRGD